VVSKEFEQHLVAALEALESGLIAANAAMEHQRKGAIAALSATIEFINSIPRWESQSLAMPLVGLLAALAALDSGRTVPMLQPSTIKNRPPEPPFRKVRRAAIIHCLNLLIDAGMEVEKACKFVAPLVRKAGMPIGG
jgi:hypothetical protein